MLLPFLVDLCLPSSNEDITIQLEIFASRSNLPVDEEDYANCGDLLRLFVAAVNGQAFSRGKPQGGKSDLAIVKHYWNTARLASCFDLKAKMVPADAFLVLVALLSQSHHGFQPIERMSIKATSSGKASVSCVDVLGADAKGLYLPERIPFEVQQADTLGQKNIVITVEFQNRLTGEPLRQAKDALNIWAQLVALGGFQLSFEALTGLPSFSRISQVGPCGVQVVLDRFNGDRAVWNALVAMALHLHNQGHGLACISID